LNLVTSTSGLVERVHKGDGDAFALLFDKYSRRLAVLIHYRLSDSLRANLEVDDVLQEVFLRAFRDIGSFQYRAPGSFMNWLSSIANHVIIDLARFQGRQQRQAVDRREPVDTTTPSRVLRQKEDLAGLIEKLNILSDEYREIILLAKVEGLSTGEMAERLGKSREAVALLLHRAIKRFRAVALP
jgi:RNA polymerase sigma-70 factor (ECF subfamily)